MQKKLFLTFAALATLVLAGCSQGTTNVNEPALNGDYVADFSKGESDEVFASDGWSNGQPFNAVWKKENISYSNGQMHLVIKDEPTEAGGENYPYTAGEARTHKLYGYGDFEVRMKPTNVVGSVSTFFTYTDKWNKVNGVENKHDEIDIEFLGKDTTKVQFNYFVGGQGGHEFMYDLGFDASKEFHNYGFRWAKNAITWFVDGKSVYQVAKENSDELPSQNGRIMTSYWPSSAAHWSGTYAGATNDTVDYEWIKSSGSTIYADGEEPEPVPTEYDWSKVDPVDMSFGGDSCYAITKEAGVTNVTYEQPAAWQPVNASVPEVANTSNAVNVTLKNNGPTNSEIRVDVLGTTKVGNHSVLNVQGAYVVGGGHSEIYTDMEWGGTKITLASNEEVQLVVPYDITTARGAATGLNIFLDSLSETPAAHPGGNVNISNIKFANTGEDPIEPVGPTDEWVDADLTFASTPVYTVAKNEGVSNVTYEPNTASGWGNITADISTVANDGKNAVKFTFKNNGENAVHVRVDVQGTTKVGNSDCLNTSATANDVAIYTDLEWGGSVTDVAAGATVNFVINYDTETEKGAAVSLLVFLDSTQSDPCEHGGNVDLSGFKFAALEESAGVGLSFWKSSENYILTPGTDNKSVTVDYTGVNGSGYSDLIGTGDFSEVTNLATTTVVKMDIANDGSHAVKIRIDLKNEGASAFLDTNATLDGEVGSYSGLYIDGDGVSFYVTEGKTVTVAVDIDQSTNALDLLILWIDSCGAEGASLSGSVTFSNFIFE